MVGYQDDTKFGTTTHYAKLLLTDGKVIEVETESSASSLDKHIVAYTKGQRQTSILWLTRAALPLLPTTT